MDSIISRLSRRRIAWTRVLAGASGLALLAGSLGGFAPGLVAAQTTGASAQNPISVTSDGYFAGLVQPGSTEWFHFAYAGNNNQVTINLAYEPASADKVDFFVYTGSASSPRREASTPTRTNNTLSMPFSDPGQQDVYVQVVDNDVVSASFVGNVTPSSQVMNAPTPNGGAETTPAATSAGVAQPINSDGSFLGTLGPQQATWYKLYYGNPGANTTISASFAPTGGSPDLNVYTGSDVNNLTQQSGSASVSGDTLSRSVNLPSAQWVYFTVVNDNNGSPLAYAGSVSPVSTPPATATPTTTPTASPSLTPTPTPSPTATAIPAAPTVPHDARYFFPTQYRIDNDAIWGYFQARGGVETFGYPVSRTFTFLGCTTQIFQRQVAQVCAGGQPQLINLLDPDIFPYTRVNGSTFPAPDPAIKNATPKVSDPTYATAILDFVRANAPDVWQGQSVNFGSTFFNTVTPDQAGTSDPGILGLLDLEVWGAPISQPAADPSNPQFIYQRFQRGIMHYEAATGQTHGILLADYLKQILIGPNGNPNLPADLAQQAQGSKYFAQYCPGQSGWLCRPADLPGTDLTFAFVQE